MIQRAYSSPGFESGFHRTFDSTLVHSHYDLDLSCNVDDLNLRESQFTCEQQPLAHTKLSKDT